MCDSKKTEEKQNTNAPQIERKFGITKDKSEDFSDWYTQVCLKADLIDLYTIRGCYIMKPASMFIWTQIKNFVTTFIEGVNVNEVYFPMLISHENLAKEQSHIDNFEPEVAWITKSGNTNIEPLAVRPTSEAVMYPYFSKWITSHRDLPLKVNQWCNILRWEIKSTVPFIRGREFLWQEGHCAYNSKEECDSEVLNILDLYARVYKDLLAVPVVKGKKVRMRNLVALSTL
ncbi:prolyl-tRNA synthetase [Edhazardia aedis USNM 41457]|uniref:proline--tRNA ligase n=1 Tax=Edhazardia aedis (strain USNM 41457) TaxID=1003232 RepID=J9D485_EDHAE|nr:prolyl-tRNA synthetase [Edhazardia aedis USNM 41457]|eukprot:EJW02364.1 prolyl-tRNA synthetase [Edhazardia aedis USNM 41457]